MPSNITLNSTETSNFLIKNEHDAGVGFNANVGSLTIENPRSFIGNMVAGSVNLNVLQGSGSTVRSYSSIENLTLESGVFTLENYYAGKAETNIILGKDATLSIVSHPSSNFNFVYNENHYHFNIPDKGDDSTSVTICDLRKLVDTTKLLENAFSNNTLTMSVPEMRAVLKDYQNKAFEKVISEFMIQNNISVSSKMVNKFINDNFFELSLVAKNAQKENSFFNQKNFSKDILSYIASFLTLDDVMSKSASSLTDITRDNADDLGGMSTLGEVTIEEII